MTCGQKIRPVFSVTLGAPIAQLDRASDYGSEGYRFNSYWVRQLQATEHQAFLFLHREPHKKTVKTCLANSWPIFGSWLGYSLTRHLRQAESSRFGRPAVTKGAAGFHRSSSG